MSHLLSRLGEIRRAPFFSPTGFLVRAAWLTLFLLAMKLGGLEDYTSGLALTFPEGSSPQVAMFLCTLYVLTWFAFVGLVPIFLLAAGILAIWSRFSPPG